MKNIKNLEYTNNILQKKLNVEKWTVFARNLNIEHREVEK